jgi:hypothetical protein
MQIGALIKTAWLGYIYNQLYLKLQPSLELISVLNLELRTQFSIMDWSYVSVNAELWDGFFTLDSKLKLQQKDSKEWEVW